MLLGLTSNNILMAVKGLLGPEVLANVNNGGVPSLNPYHIAIATGGYRIQSRVLNIPDRWDFFSPDPPRLQVHQGASFLFMTLILGVLLG
ncbi:hypothetical protein DL769_002255 [Monosporascus sp. CRB-8-3]|nr:hypothetical protein DL769_002255 [Monosporascus sp. CRB-8-3]